MHNQNVERISVHSIVEGAIEIFCYMYILKLNAKIECPSFTCTFEIFSNCADLISNVICAFELNCTNRFVHMGILNLLNLKA